MVEQLLDASDVAEALKVSKACVYQMIRTRELNAVKFGKSVRVRPVDLAAFIVNNLIIPVNSELDFLLKQRKLQ